MTTAPYDASTIAARPQARTEVFSTRWPIVAALGVVFVLSLLVFANAWFSSGGRPMHGLAGWFSFSDQGWYLKEARILASGHFPSKADYFYGIGYPIVAVPPLLIHENRDPFAPFNALAFATSMVMVTVLGIRLRSLAFGIVCTALVMFGTPLLDVTFVPWSSTVTLLVISVVLVLATGPRSWRAALLIGLGAGWCFAARYIDGLWPVLITIGTFLRRPREIIIALAAAGVIGGAMLYSDWAVFGNPLTTPYSAHVEPNGVGGSDQSAGAYDLSAVPVRLFGVFTGVGTNGQRMLGESLSNRFFWALLAPLGLWFLFRDRHRLRVPFAAAFATSAIALVFYLSFRASGAGMLQFGGLHYFKAWFPLWALLAAYGGIRVIELLQPMLRPELRSPA